MPLRIVSWNCNMALRHKFEALLALRPDVAIIQECAKPDEGWRPACRDADWIGFNAQKGLGIFTFGDLTLRRHASYSDRFSLYLPVEIRRPVPLQPARRVGSRCAQDSARRDQRPGGRDQLLSTFSGSRAVCRRRRLQPPAPADVGAIKGVTRRVRSRAADRCRAGQRRPCHERCHRPGCAAPHTLSSAPFQPRLRGRLSLHPSRRASAPHRIRGGRSARLAALERSRTAGRRARSDRREPISSAKPSRHVGPNPSFCSVPSVPQW